MEYLDVDFRANIKDFMAGYADKVSKVKWVQGRVDKTFFLNKINLVLHIFYLNFRDLHLLTFLNLIAYHFLK